MRVIETKAYKFDELNDKAKERALDWWARTYEVYDGDEIVESIKKFVELFGGRFKDWSLDWYGASRSDWKISLPEEVENLSGVRLYKWIVNNDIPLKGDCPLTGMSWDESLLDEVRKFIKAPKNTTTKDLVDWSIQNLLSAVEKDVEYQTYGDGAIENIIANEYEFTEDGKRV